MIAHKTSEMTSQIENGEPVSFAFHYPTETTLKFLNSLMTKILSRDDKVYLQNTLITIMREMIVNAVKANTKRIFFKERNLDIKDESDYEQGMLAFKAFIQDHREYTEEILKDHNLKVFLGLKKLNNGIKVIIQNNSTILPDELQKIQTRLEKAREYHDFSEVYEDVTDEMEGEGLGILLTMLFLRNSGIGEDSFRIASEKGITQSSFVIPFVLRPREFTTEIRDKIINEVEHLPTFPEQVNELLVLCKNKDASINFIAEKILMDPSLTASVLKLANSAGFISGKRIEQIDEAIMVIGLKNLNAILVAASAQKILEERYSSFKKIWEHSNKIAILGRIIARVLKKKDLLEHTFISCLLHDLGKIVLLATNTKLSEWISSVALKRKMRTSTVIEEVAIGISHSTIGAMMARKWNLPDYIAESIRFHHAPLNASPVYRDVINITYLANMLYGIEEKRYDYFTIEDEVLAALGIENEVQLKKFHMKCMQIREEINEL